MKKLVGFLMLLVSGIASAQVDTSYIYNTTTPFGTLDIRLAKSATRYYYLQENRTISFRESAPGVKTNTYRDMTSWDSSPYTQGNMREKNGTADYFIMNYRLLFPVNYDPAYADGYPLIVMMHGAGERGNCWDANCYWADRSYKPLTNVPAAPTTVDHQLLNNDHNLTHGGSPHLTARNLAAGKLPNDPTLPERAFPGFVLFAQNLNGWDINAVHDAIRLIRLVTKKYKIDQNKIYVHGLSNGGVGTYEVVKRAPWLFAAGLPMSSPSDAAIISKGLIPRIAHVPLWTFQGGRDTAPPPSRTQGYVNTFRNAGMEVRYSLYPNLAHGTWNTAYAEPDFFSWMLTKNKKNIHVFYNVPKVCLTNGVGAKMGLSPGFRAYQWEKDGAVIGGATTNEYTANSPGVYRARFSRKANPGESDWNAWSEPVTITESNPAQPPIAAIGTQFMKGPDGNSFYNAVFLKTHAHDKYYWYRNGVLINVAGTTLDDTTRTIRIYNTSNTYNGEFTVQTKGFDNCPSPVSAPINLYFGNSAPFVADSNIPSNFTGSVLSQTSTSLQWQDNSNIEAGYEIWRRKPGDFFRLAGKTGPDATSYIDTNLEPSIAYQYKIRAFTETGRSKYAPSDNTNINLVLTTQPDNEAPTAPSNLVVVSNTTNSITLAWTAATDDTGIRQYRVTYGGTTLNTNSKNPTYTITGLPINTAYYISVVAQDLGNNLSTASETVVGSTYVSGLTYGHSTGAWTDLDQITSWNTPEFTGVVPTFTLEPRTQEEFFFFEYKGFLFINEGGTYRFRTTSDDGSRLFLNNVQILDNDGVHGNVTVSSADQTLAAGPIPISVRYFEYTGSQSLTVQYRGPDTGGSWVTIPESALRSGSTPPTPVEAASMGSAVLAQSLGGETMRVNVYPNPSTSENVFVQVESLQEGPVQVKMIDMMGRAHYTNMHSAEELQRGTTIKPNHLLINGVYLIVVNQGKRVEKERLVIKN